MTKIGCTMKEQERRMTRQRGVMLEELQKIKTHPTADELHVMVRERLPRISLGTVYRNLEYLVAVGQISRLESAGSAMRFDGDTSKHQHVRCIRCGRIADLAHPLAVPPLYEIKLDGFSEIINILVEIEGLCVQCFPKTNI